jgi:pimeloyl-ACP methyl ester carboxylesterase
MRGIAAVVAVPILLGAAGLGYQAIAAEQDRRAYPPPGQFVTIRGARLHINCTGQGSPTVILESGLGGWSSYWALIQPALGGGVRVCSYDRAGLGWSDPGPQPRDARPIAVELHALLVGADVRGPYVLAAHSNGGPYARMFGSLYPEDVAGMLLADFTPTDLFDRLPATRASFDTFEQQARTFQWLAPVGVARLLMPGATAAELARVPSPAHEEILALYSTSRQWRGAG